MIGALVLFLVSTVLFVLAFLYETYLSFRRLKVPSTSRGGYLAATWEITHTLLVFAVVMLIMLFTQSLDKLSDAIFTSTFLAATVLALRAALYVYIFYVRTTKKIGLIDWLFALSHIVAALLLVIVVLQALVFVFTTHPPVNEWFIPIFIPGLVGVIVICAIPVAILYRTRK